MSLTISNKLKMPVLNAHTVRIMQVQDNYTNCLRHLLINTLRKGTIALAERPQKLTEG